MPPVPLCCRISRLEESPGFHPIYLLKDEELEIPSRGFRFQNYSFRQVTESHFPMQVSKTTIQVAMMHHSKEQIRNSCGLISRLLPQTYLRPTYLKISSPILLFSARLPLVLGSRTALVVAV
jgi:hypothetical protein